MEIIRVHWINPNPAKRVVAVEVGDGFGSTINLGIFSGDECRSLAQYLRDTASDLDPDGEEE